MPESPLRSIQLATISSATVAGVAEIGYLGIAEFNGQSKG